VSRDLTAFYAEGRRQLEVSRAEFAARAGLGSFEIRDQAPAWAAELVDGGSVAELPLLRETQLVWLRTLGSAGDGRTYFGELMRSLAATAVRDGVLRLPEPGVIGPAFAHRDPVTEEEVALGYGFWPDGAECLVLHGSRGLLWDDLAGGRSVVGPAALVSAIRLMAETLNEPRPATRQMNPLRPPAACFRSTSWTPAG
jgi:hypothetical protein